MYVGVYTIIKLLNFPTGTCMWVYTRSCVHPHTCSSRKVKVALCIVYTPTYMFQWKVQQLYIVYTPTYMFQWKVQQLYYRVYTHIHVPVGKFSSFISCIKLHTCSSRKVQQLYIVYTPTYMFQQESLVALYRVYTHIHFQQESCSSFMIVYTPTYMFQQESLVALCIVYTPTYMFQ